MTIHKIAFLGAGSIAEAVIAGLTKAKAVDGRRIMVSNRSDSGRLAYLAQEYGVQGTHDKEELLRGADIVMLAMKPKDAAEALLSLKDLIGEDQLLISLMAGVSTSSMDQLLEKQIPIIRAMPNTSAAILRSATAICPSAHATERHVEMAKYLFAAVGVVSVVTEEQMHAVTALSGSGPAYIYFVVEAMEQAAREIGLTEDISKPLILQTMIGAAEMLKLTPKHPSVLRKEITSPGGTTQAGIEVLQSFEFQQALVQCISRAAERSRELGETLEQLFKQ
ncbi:pyrroline-5-carboxylate reductase ProI [Ectobacillus ponti]|uniref:Pyrroline-5-carboxylate reductase n=1 Tax=Ectobacillus ponti TaxID=2961894 RepID=A0AA42BNX7_9BACI|nr:pyrroline-5-carboxylate reductase ProI [Ectobacillus ponti]MCP8966999.1 pyrroline-5-carboxylate reductase ProI [Ectobacillus ponti]